jgi:hypothetical protein
MCNYKISKMIITLQYIYLKFLIKLSDGKKFKKEINSYLRVADLLDVLTYQSIYRYLNYMKLHCTLIPLQ